MPEHCCEPFDENAQFNEPQTIGISVSQDAVDLCPFAVCKRFIDRSAMGRHVSSAAVARFYRIAKLFVDGEVLLLKVVEVSAKT